MVEDISTHPRGTEPFMGYNKAHGWHQCHIPENVQHYKRIEAIYGNLKANSNRSTIWFIPTHWLPMQAFRSITW
jgi:hypothetical protein